MEPSAFFQPLKPYMEALLEHDSMRRRELLKLALVPDAEICGPSRVFTGYSEVSEKIAGFHKNWPDCRLVLAGGVITFNNNGHFPMAIVGPDGLVRAAGNSVAELAADGRLQRVLAFWGSHPELPGSWPKNLSVKHTTGGKSAA